MNFSRLGPLRHARPLAGWGIRATIRCRIILPPIAKERTKAPGKKCCGEIPVTPKHGKVIAE